MHDWALLTILVIWFKGVATLAFKNSKSQNAELTAHGLMSIKIPKLEEWGESVSVNQVIGPTKLGNGCYGMKIEMQSGDIIEIEAESFLMPRIKG